MLKTIICGNIGGRSTMMSLRSVDIRGFNGVGQPNGSRSGHILTDQGWGSRFNGSLAGRVNKGWVTNGPWCNESG